LGHFLHRSCRPSTTPPQHHPQSVDELYRTFPAFAQPWRTLLRGVAISGAYFIAFRCADLPYLWLVQSILTLAITLFFFVGAMVGRHMSADLRERIDRAIRERPRPVRDPSRWGRWLDIGGCVLWIYSWRHLFGIG
jgi:hypothetical protein